MQRAVLKVFREGWGFYKYIFYRCPDIWFLVIILAFQGEYDHCKYVEQRDGTQDHKRSHAGAIVHIIDKSQSQNGSAATVRRLNKCTFFGFIFHKKLCQTPDDENGSEGGKEAEHDIASVKVFPKIILCQIFKNQDWKRCIKDIFIHGLNKIIPDDFEFVQEFSQNHYQKDGKRGVDTV